MNKLHKCHQPSGCAPMQQGFRQGGPYSPRVMAILLPDAARPATQATHSKRDISFYGFPPPLSASPVCILCCSSSSNLHLSQAIAS